MGGDDIGRDVFSRVIWGARVSLFIGVAAVAFGFVIGGTLGLTAGFYGGRFERVVIGAMDIMLAFPALVLALGLITFLSEPGTQNASLGTVTLVLTIIAIPALARITRAATLSFAQREFVTASRALGARNSRIIAREILPNVIPPMAAFALIAIAIVIVAEGALSFLGLSVASPTATWGNLIEQGRQNLDDTWWISLFPCGVMFLTLLSFNYVGDQLRRYFDVKEINL
jgi:peptide/nickel transport system permease protein